MTTVDSDLLEVFEATDGRSNSDAPLLEAFHHGLLALRYRLGYDAQMTSDVIGILTKTVFGCLIRGLGEFAVE